MSWTEHEDGTVAGSGTSIHAREGATLASASTVTLTDFYHQVSGTTQVNSFAWAGQQSPALFVIRPTGAFPIGTGGNIVNAPATATVGVDMQFVYNGTDFRYLAANAADSVTDAMLRDSAALSVIGRSANSTGNPADIAAGTNGFTLRRVNSTLAFASDGDIYPEDYGTVGGANDTAALAAALAAAISTKRILRLRPGVTYVLTSALTIDGSVRIVGYGATISQGTHNTFAIDEDADIGYVNIEGVTATSSTAGRFVEYACSNVTITNCNLTNLSIHLVRTDANLDAVVRNMHIANNVIVCNPASATTAIGIQVGNATNVWIDGNTVSRAQSDGIQVTFEPAAATSTATTSVGSKSVAVGDGTLFQIGDIIAIPGAGDYDHSNALYASIVAISGNTLTIDRAASAVVTGGDIFLGSGNINITNNTCFANGDDGIDTFSGGRYTVVTGNTMYGNASCGLQVKAVLSENGVLFYNFSEGAIIANNFAYGNTSSGLYTKADNVTLTGNQVEANGSGGIQIDANSAGEPVVRNVKVSNNVIRNQPGFGIYVVPSILDADVSGNTLYLCGSTDGAINAALRFRARSGRIVGNIITPTSTSAYGLLVQSTAPTAWAGTTALTLGAERIPTVPNGYRYMVSVAGTTAGVEPTWPTTPGSTVTDGTVTWVFAGQDVTAGVYHIDGNRIVDGATSQDFQIVLQTGDVAYVTNNITPSVAMGSLPTYRNHNNSFDTLFGSVSWNPASLADGAGETSANITVTGAAFGDSVSWSAPYSTQGFLVTAAVSAADTVTIRIQNETGGVVDLGSGTWRVTVRKRYGA